MHGVSSSRIDTAGTYETVVGFSPKHLVSVGLATGIRGICVEWNTAAM
jgi:hypothetical protein